MHTNAVLGPTGRAYSAAPRRPIQINGGPHYIEPPLEKADCPLTHLKFSASGLRSFLK